MSTVVEFSTTPLRVSFIKCALDSFSTTGGVHPKTFSLLYGQTVVVPLSITESNLLFVT